MEKCAHFLVSDPALLCGRWLDEFICEGAYKYHGLHIELGCGKGRFAVETAQAEQNTLYVALEKTTNVLIHALEQADNIGADNIRFINTMAEEAINFFAPDEVERIYLNFCDPWPGNRHSKRRLTARKFLELYSRILQPSGEIHLKTDNLPFFEFSLREFESSGFLLLEETRDLHKNGPVGIMTEYELKFYGKGLPIYQCKMRNRERLNP